MNKLGHISILFLCLVILTPLLSFAGKGEEKKAQEDHFSVPYYSIFLPNGELKTFQMHHLLDYTLYFDPELPEVLLYIPCLTFGHLIVNLGGKLVDFANEENSVEKYMGLYYMILKPSSRQRIRINAYTEVNAFLYSRSNIGQGPKLTHIQTDILNGFSLRAIQRYFNHLELVAMIQ